MSDAKQLKQRQDNLEKLVRESQEQQRQANERMRIVVEAMSDSEPMKAVLMAMIPKSEGQGTKATTTNEPTGLPEEAEASTEGTTEVQAQPEQRILRSVTKTGKVKHTIARTPASQPPSKRRKVTIKAPTYYGNCKEDATEV